MGVDTVQLVALELVVVVRTCQVVLRLLVMRPITVQVVDRVEVTVARVPATSHVVARLLITDAAAVHVAAR